MEGIHRWCRVQVREILTPLFCQPLSSKAITTLPVLTSGYWDQEGNPCLLSSSPVTLFNLGSRPTSDHKNGFPGLDNPENRWQSCYGCSTEPSTHSTHCSHSDHSSAGTLWMSFHPCPHWCPFLLMQGRALCFSVLQWCRQEGILRAVVHTSRASTTLFLSRLNTQIVLFGSLSMASKQRSRARFCLPFSGTTGRGIWPKNSVCFLSQKLTCSEYLWNFLLPLSSV